MKEDEIVITIDTRLTIPQLLDPAIMAKVDAFYRVKERKKTKKQSLYSFDQENKVREMRDARFEEMAEEVALSDL